MTLKGWVITIMPLTAVTTVILLLQQAGQCYAILPFTELVSEHRIKVENQNDYSQRLKKKLEGLNFNVELVIHRNFRRTAVEGMGDIFTTYGTLACSRQTVISSDNIEKEGQQLIIFQYNWLYGKANAEKTKKIILTMIDELNESKFQSDQLRTPGP